MITLLFLHLFNYVCMYVLVVCVYIYIYICTQHLYSTLLPVTFQIHAMMLRLVSRGSLLSVLATSNQ